MAETWHASFPGSAPAAGCYAGQPPRAPKPSGHSWGAAGWDVPHYLPAVNNTAMLKPATSTQSPAAHDHAEQAHGVCTTSTGCWTCRLPKPPRYLPHQDTVFGSKYTSVALAPPPSSQHHAICSPVPSEQLVSQAPFFKMLNKLH